MKPIQVLILAGGIGKRFWPLKTNKFLFPFFGKSLLVHNLERLVNAGFTNALIVTTPEDEASIKQLQVSGLEISTVIQSEASGMASAVLAASSKITNDPLLIMNATDLVEPQLYHQMHNELSSGVNFIVAKKVTDYFPGGYLKLNGDKIEAIIEKPGAGNEPSNLVNLVFDGLQHPREFLHLLENTTSTHDDVYEVALTKLLQKTSVSVIEHNGYWQATKYPWHVLDVMNILFNDLLPKIDLSASISPKATVEGNVTIEANVKIFEGAVVKGPVYIGKNTIIANNALVRQSMVRNDCVVGYNTEVTRSYVGDNCWFHSNYVGDSVLENNISFGAGSILANLRLDEGEINSVIKAEKIGTSRNKLGAIIGKNVRFGVNTSIMPGVKIGSGSMIGAGLTIGQDIPDNSYVKGETNFTISPSKVQLDPSHRDQFKQKL